MSFDNYSIVQRLINLVPNTDFFKYALRTLFMLLTFALLSLFSTISLDHLKKSR